MNPTQTRPGRLMLVLAQVGLTGTTTRAATQNKATEIESAAPGQEIASIVQRLGPRLPLMRPLEQAKPICARLLPINYRPFLLLRNSPGARGESRDPYRQSHRQHRGNAVQFSWTALHLSILVGEILELDQAIHRFCFHFLCRVDHARKKCWAERSHL